jgi:hypothetical protein
MDEEDRRHAAETHDLAGQAYVEAMFCGLALEATLAVLRDHGVLSPERLDEIVARLESLFDTMRGRGASAHQATIDAMIRRTQVLRQRFSGAPRPQ